MAAVANGARGHSSIRGDFGQQTAGGARRVVRSHPAFSSGAMNPMTSRSIVNPWARVAAIAFLLCLWLGLPIHARGDITSIVSFGDSLTDTGNVFATTGQ